MSGVKAKPRVRSHQGYPPSKKARFVTQQSRAPAGAAVAAFILGAASSLSIEPLWSLLGSFVLLGVATLLGVKQKLVLATCLLLGGFFSLGSVSYGIVHRNIDRQPLRRLLRALRAAPHHPVS